MVKVTEFRIADLDTADEIAPYAAAVLELVRQWGPGNTLAEFSYIRNFLNCYPEFQQEIEDALAARGLAADVNALLASGLRHSVEGGEGAMLVFEAERLSLLANGEAVDSLVDGMFAEEGTAGSKAVPPENRLGFATSARVLRRRLTGGGPASGSSGKVLEDARLLRALVAGKIPARGGA